MMVRCVCVWWGGRGVQVKYAFGIWSAVFHKLICHDSILIYSTLCVRFLHSSYDDVHSCLGFYFSKFSSGQRWRKYLHLPTILLSRLLIIYIQKGHHLHQKNRGGREALLKINFASDVLFEWPLKS